MKTIYIRGNKSESANMLRAQLEALGHKVVRAKTEPYDVVVCWGMSTREGELKKAPTLNGSVNLFNKYAAMRRMQKANVNIPFIFSVLDAPEDAVISLPWFARKVY